MLLMPQGSARDKKILARRKLVLYSLIITIFLSLCAIYSWIILSSARGSSQNVLKEWNDHAQTQIHKNINYKIADLTIRLSAYLASDPPADARGFVNGLKARYPGDSLGFMAQDGVAYNQDGKPIGWINPENLGVLAKKKFFIASIFTPEENGHNILEVIPVKDRTFFLVREQPAAGYLDDILRDAAPSARYIGIYGSDGTLLAHLNKGENGILDDKTLHLLGKKLQQFAASHSQQRIEQIGFSPNYAIYTLLEDTQGWVLSVYIPTGQFLPFFNGLLIMSLSVIAGLFCLVLLVIVLDIINDREKQKELEKIGCMDLLTGLLNSLGLQSALKEYLQDMPGGKNSFICLDIASFWRFNSMFGYAVGDNLLRTVGGVLKTRYMLGTRINGDLFAFVAPSVPNIVQDINTNLCEAVKNELGKEYLQVISFKAGIFPITENHSYGEVYDGALLALRAAKNTASETGVIFGEEHKKQVELQKQIEMNMLHALSKGEFLFYVQPKYNLKTKACSGGEALVRWDSEKLGFIMPDQFIPLFEKTGFIVEIDFFMLNTAFQLLSDERKRGLEALTLSVNLSKITLTFPNYLERMRLMVKKYPDIPLPLLEIEITESVLENDYEGVVSRLYSLKDMGFRIAMDDFGSGFSSLNTLRELPVDVLKIDREFLKESDVSDRSRKIIRNVINMSKELGISVVCEGVETQEQVDFLNECECDIIQGYHYAKPMPYEEYENEFLIKKKHL